MGTLRNEAHLRTTQRAGGVRDCTNRQSHGDLHAGARQPPARHVQQGILRHGHLPGDPKLWPDREVRPHRGVLPNRLQNGAHVTRGSDSFLAHYDQYDKPQWAVKMGSDGEDKGRALAVDPSDGNIVTFGYFTGISRFGHLVIKSTKPRLDCAHGCAGYVAKFLKDGRALWVRELGQPVHHGPQNAATKSSVDYWDARAVEFMLANPEPEFNLDFWSDKRKETTIIRNPEDLEKYV